MTVSVYNLGLDYVAVPEAEPAEDVPCVCSTCSYGRAHLAMYPNTPAAIAPSADVPLAAWEIELLAGERWDVRFGDLITLNGGTYRVVDADGKPILEPAPAPTPPLPWIEHPAAWWRDLTDHFELIYPSVQMDTADTPADWQRVAVIPWDLIDQLRVVVPGDDDNGLNEAADAILDAADGVTS